MSKFKVGQLVMKVKFRNSEDVAALQAEGYTLVKTPLGTVGTVQYYAGDDEWGVEDGFGEGEYAGYQLMPINDLDISLGEDTYMEYDTKAKKPVKESA